MDASTETKSAGTAAKLLLYWDDVATSARKFARLSPKGAVASSLKFHGGDIARVRAQFDGDKKRLQARYPEFWDGVQALISAIEKEGQ